MKVGPKVILLFRDPDGFGASIYAAIKPNPNNFPKLRRSEEEPFELSLEGYGIEGHKACGDVAHFVDDDDDGQLLVTMLLLHYYEPPVLACAVNEILRSIERSNESTFTLILPFVLPASKFKFEENNASVGRKVSLYGAQLGPETDFNQAIVKKTQILPSSTQIYHEPLACLLQFVHVLKVPSVLLVGKIHQNLPNKAVEEEHEVLHELGELLASSLSLSFVKDRVKLNLGKTSKVAEEPWRALYG